MDSPIITLDFLNKRPLSSSSLKAFRRSPLHYLYYLSQPRVEPSQSQLIGAVLDCLLLTDNLFDQRFIVAPHCDRRTKEGKILFENFVSKAAGKQIIDQETLDVASLMKESVSKNEEAMSLLNKITQTQSINKWVDEITP